MARTYSAATDRTEVSSSGTVDTAATFTWVQLINPSNASAGGQPRRKSGSGIFFVSGTNGDVFATVARATAQSRADTNTLPFPNGADAYLILRYDAAATPALTISKGTVDGVLTQVAASNSGVGSSANGSGATTSDAGSALGIGGRPAGAGNPFPGDISSTAYWTRVLTDGELSSWILNRDVFGMGLWLEHGLTGTNDIDLSGNGNTGTVTGAAVADHGPSPDPFQSFSASGDHAASVAATPALVVTTQPTAKVTPGVAMTAVVVKMTTDGSTTDTSFTGNVTATWKASNLYGSLGGTTTVAAVAGIATFSNLVPAASVENIVDSVITFSASGVADLDATAFKLWGTKLTNWRAFFDDADIGDANVLYAWDFRMSATLVSSKYSSVPDVLGTDGGRTPGAALTQGTGANRPGMGGTIGVDAYATFDGANTFINTVAASNLKLIGSGGTPNPLNVWLVCKVTANGAVGGIERDETDSTQNPYMVCKPASGNWAFSLSTDGTGVSSHQTGTATPDFGYAWDSNKRLVGMIKRGWNTDANVMGRFQCYMGGVPIAKHSRFPDATNADCKLVLGRHGSSYMTGEVYAVIVTKKTISNLQIEKIRAFFETEFGTLSARDTAPRVAIVGNSIDAGDTSTTELNGTNGSGLTTSAYYAADRNTGRGKWFTTQMPLVKNIHQINFAHHGNTLGKMTTDFSEDVSVLKESISSGVTAVVWSEVLNSLNSGEYTTLGQIQTALQAYFALCTAKGIKFYPCTPPDARVFYTAGVINAIGTIAKNLTADMRANPTLYGDGVIDVGYVGGVFEIDKVGTKSYENATYYNNPVSDGGHLIDAGQLARGNIIRDYFDNNPSALYPNGSLPVLLNLRRQYAA